MGNCSFKGTADGFLKSIRILTDSGTMLELKSPKLAKEILENYPGYAIFPPGHVSTTLADHEHLLSGQFYYLLPLEKQQKQLVEVAEKPGFKWMEQMEPPNVSSADFVDSLGSGSALEVLPSQGNGVWKVKLVISTKQLEEIFSEEVNTEALIEKMRMAAASSANLTPRRTKISWLVGWRKPVFSNVFNQGAH